MRGTCIRVLIQTLTLSLALSSGAAAQETPPRSWLDGLPFLPIPEIDTAPHSGLTFGLIPVVLGNNDRGQIDSILAPDIIYSQYFGWGARWRIFRNPSDDEKWSVVGGAKEHVEREFDAEYDLGLLRDRPWSWILHAMYDRSGTGRFFGIGNNSLLADQTTFIDSQERLEVTASRNFTHALQLSYLVRADSVEIEQSALASLPSIETRYPDLNGVGDVSELHQRLVLSYDTRDSVNVPTGGERLAAFAGWTTRALGSSVNYAYYGADGAVFQPAGANLVLAAHAALRYMPSYSDAPFWAYSQLGGETSTVAEAQPLRAYGDGRFVDRNGFAASVEVRTRVRDFHLFDTDLGLEIAPFVDTGKVFPDMHDSPFTHLHVGAGVGLRVIANPFVVGFLDIGFGHERAAVFSGINYPF